MSDLCHEIQVVSRRVPHRTAVRSDTDTMTYAQLHARSCAVADELQRRGIRVGDRVAVMLPPTASAVAAILGILRAGAAYVPIDPSCPTQRALDMVDACEPASVVVEAHHPAAVELSGRAPCVAPAILCSSTAKPRPAPPVRGEQTACMFHTSGSTGRPKGVCISRAALGYFPLWARGAFGLGPRDRVAGVSSLGFDLSTFDIFASLSAGASLHFVDPARRMLPSALARFLERHRITAIYAVPSLYSLLAARGAVERRNLRQMRLVLFAGEPFPPRQLRDLMRRLPRTVRYCNLYGPTETNVCTWHPVRRPPPDHVDIPIGVPVPGTRLRLVDPLTGRPRSRWGEICVSGPGLMTGYRGGGPEDCWVDGGAEGIGRAYRTGDLGRRDEDGLWRFLGRADNQIKLLGYRIEPREVELCLERCPDIRQAVVLKDCPVGRPERLVAFVTPADGARGAPVIAKLRRWCRRRLPSFMVPAGFRVVTELPLNGRGKRDTRRLLALLDSPA